ncbi:MAG: hydroxyacid dehydrogenase [Alphaproteobacteria bacterium]|nr:hydroxyacid dehydrogenase [Alphaproteobacteria bacterium]
MKIAFFNSDQMLNDYFKDKTIQGATMEFISEPAGVTGAGLDADAISVFVNSNLDAATLKKFPNLKLIATRSTGFNHIDTDYCQERGIKLHNVNGYGEFAVSEFAIGLMISLMRKIFTAYQDMMTGKIDLSKYQGRDIHGKTVGVFGTGTIGSHFARLAKGFGTRVIAYDRKPNPDLEGMVEFVDLDTLYKESDIVALNIPANAENYHIVDEKAIAKMKRGVVLLNIARGELIKSGALYDALISGQVGGVAQDALELEASMKLAQRIDTLTQDQMEIVLYNKKIMQLDNVLITPHTAFNSVEANIRIMDMTYDTLQAFAKSDSPCP